MPPVRPCAAVLAGAVQASVGARSGRRTCGLQRVQQGQALAGAGHEASTGKQRQARRLRQAQAGRHEQAGALGEVRRPGADMVAGAHKGRGALVARVAPLVRVCGRAKRWQNEAK